MPYDITERPEADRVKAFELYMTAAQTGKPRSHRQIAAELGVSSMTIGRWSKVDDWDGKVNKILAQTAQTTETTSQAVRRRVRIGLLNGLDELQKITTDKSSSAKDKIDAVKAIAGIALKIEAFTSGAFGKEASAQKPIEFNDDLEDVKWQPTTELPSPPEGSADVIEEKPLPTPEVPESPPLPLSVEASAFPSEVEAEAILEALEQKDF